ncbi:ATP-binding protein [Bifidobacterium mongoliense]|uniref:ATP-binding protein n=1 Tax=Bifidobacterium mongoliense TaxID=518643 RepID=UPI0030EF1101
MLARAHGPAHDASRVRVGDERFRQANEPDASRTWGREQLAALEFVGHAENLVPHGDVGAVKMHLAIAVGMLACRRMIPVKFFTAAGLVMRLRKRPRTRTVSTGSRRPTGRVEHPVIDELGHPPVRLRRGASTVSDHR